MATKKKRGLAPDWVDAYTTPATDVPPAPTPAAQMAPPASASRRAGHAKSAASSTETAPPPSAPVTEDVSADVATTPAPAATKNPSAAVRGVTRRPRAGRAAHHTPAPSTDDVLNKKTRAVFYMPEDLLQEARNTVVHLAGYPEYLTLAKLAEMAMRRELDRLKKKHMEGKDFPVVVDGPLKGGRPIGS